MKKGVDKPNWICYNQTRRRTKGENLDPYGSIAQLGEHLPYKQRVIGSSPIVSTSGLVVQLVRTLPCHGRGRGFESHPDRQCGFSSSGRAPPCQGGGSEFEPRRPLHMWKFSSAGRASALQAEGQRFEPVNFHLIWPGSSVG